jgi:hypothetical protein
MDKVFNTSEVKIGDKFKKPLNKGKFAECEIVDIVQRISTVTGKVFDVEYWAKSISKEYTTRSSFQVAKTTVFRYRI